MLALKIVPSKTATGCVVSDLQIPSENPEIEIRDRRGLQARRGDVHSDTASGQVNATAARGKRMRWRSRPMNRYGGLGRAVDRSRNHGRSSARRTSSLASLGLAFPPVAFITWPTRKPSTFVCPARVLRRRFGVRGDHAVDGGCNAPIRR